MPDEGFTILPDAKPVTCPACGVSISARYIADEFLCPACASGLRLRRPYFWVASSVSIVLASLTLYALGFRDDALWMGACLAVWPFLILVLSVTARVFPPDVEASGDFRGILHPPEPQDPSLPPDPIIWGASGADRKKTPEHDNDGVSVFRLPEQRSLEGAVMTLAALAALVGTLYIVAEPVIQKIAPDYRSTREGPKGFPVLIYIGPDALRVSNRSDVPWNCSVTMGRKRSHRAWVLVPPQSASTLPYRAFQTPEDDAATDVEARRTLARQKLEINCLDRATRTDLWTFW